MRMIARIGACVGSLGIICAAEAADAPAAFRNKSISVAYVVTVDAVSDRGTTSNPRNVSQTIYISSEGRVFLKREGSHGRDSETHMGAPEQTAGHFSFQGNRLVGTRTLIGGAAQLIVSFDPGFQSCTASVHFGHESGKPFKYKGLRGEVFTAKGRRPLRRRPARSATATRSRNRSGDGRLA
jgi:hypothetical protein